MAPSRCLPDGKKLDALFAGVMARSAAHLLPLPTRRLRFSEEPTPRTEDTVRPVGPRTMEDAARPLAELDAAAPMSFNIEVRGETLEARLDSLLLWLVGSTGGFAAFVADAEGLALANRHAPESYLVATAALAIAERAMSEYVPRPSEGTTVIELDGANVLQIIWANTTAGRLAVGLVLAEPLGRTLVSAARRVLQLSVEGNNEVSQ